MTSCRLEMSSIEGSVCAWLLFSIKSLTTSCGLRNKQHRQEDDARMRIVIHIH